MFTALAILSSFIVFMVAMVAPHRGTDIQRRLQDIRLSAHFAVRDKPKPLGWVVRGATNMFHFLLHKSAAAGKKSRWKLPF